MALISVALVAVLVVFHSSASAFVDAATERKEVRGVEFETVEVYLIPLIFLQLRKEPGNLCMTYRHVTGIEGFCHSHNRGCGTPRILVCIDCVVLEELGFDLIRRRSPLAIFVIVFLQPGYSRI